MNRGMLSNIELFITYMASALDNKSDRNSADKNLDKQKFDSRHKQKRQNTSTTRTQAQQEHKHSYIYLENGQPCAAAAAAATSTVLSSDSDRDGEISGSFSSPPNNSAGS